MRARRHILVLGLFFLLLPVAATAENTPAVVDLQDAPTITVDWSKGNVQSVVLHADRTLVLRNGQKGGRYLLIVRQDDSGGHSITWPSNIVWPGNRPTSNFLTQTAGRKDFLSFFCDGETYDALAISQNY